MRTDRYACRSVTTKRMPGIVWPANFDAVCATGIVMASKGMPGSWRSFITRATSGMFSQEADLLEWAVRASTLGDGGALEVDGARIAHQRGVRAKVGRALGVDIVGRAVLEQGTGVVAGV